MIRLADSEFGNMKKSGNWVRQAALDTMLDQLVEERECTPAELNPYDAAKALDVEPNGEFYKKVRDWKQRHSAESDSQVMEVPPHVQAEFRETVDRFAGDAMNSFLRAVRTVGSDLDSAATLRVGDAERRADESLAEVNSLLDSWTDAEAKRDAALARVAELEQALADAERREGILTVRLDERVELIKALKLEMASDSVALVTPHGTGVQSDPVNEGIDASSLDRGEIDASAPVATAPADQPVATRQQPSAAETTVPMSGQREMPDVTSDAADEADDSGYDHG